MGCSEIDKQLHTNFTNCHIYYKISTLNSHFYNHQPSFSYLSGSQILSLATHERLKRTKRILVQNIVWSEMLYNKVKSMDILNDTDYENIESKANFMDKKTVLIDAIMRRSGSDVEKLKQIFQELKQDIITKILSGG